MYAKIHKLSTHKKISAYQDTRCGYVIITGEDAGKYLQSQFSHDLSGLKKFEYRYGLFLTEKGKVLADATLLKFPTHWAAFSYYCSSDVLAKTIERNVIMDDVHIENQAVTVLSLWGDIGKNEIPPEGTFIQEEGKTILKGKRSAQGSVDFIVTSKEENNDLLKDYKGVTVSDEDKEWERIRSGIPAVHLDVKESDLPHEAGLGEAAVAYNKGCYVGQEGMMRLKTRGAVRRSLYRIKFQGKCSPGDNILLNDKGIGEVRSIARDLAMVMGKCAEMERAEVKLGISSGAEIIAIEKKMSV